LPVIQFYMLRNYIKIAFRNFQKQRSYTLLNVIGLSLGMAAVYWSFSMLSTNEALIRSIRAQMIFTGSNTMDTMTVNWISKVQSPFRPLVRPWKETSGSGRIYQDYPRCGCDFARNTRQGTGIVPEEKVYFADSMLFKVFDFSWLKEMCRVACGEQQVICRRHVQKYFDGQDPIEKTWTWMVTSLSWR